MSTESKKHKSRKYESIKKQLEDYKLYYSIRYSDLDKLFDSGWHYVSSGNYKLSLK